MNYLILAAVYLDAIILTHFNIIHPKWWAWFWPVIIVILKAITDSVIAFSQKNPLLSIPMFVVLCYALIEGFFKMGIMS